MINLAVHTWHQLGTARGMDFSLGEETITDNNLYHLATHHPNQVDLYKHSSNEEGDSGADWEWWLGSNNQWMRMRVQAKKLHPDSLSYQKLDRTIGDTDIRQIDRLINQSQADNFDPLYCFYNYWPQEPPRIPWNCPNYPYHSPLLGCSIADAYTIRQLINAGQDGWREVAKASLPWSCLTCCPQHQNQADSLAGRARNRLQELRETLPETIDRSYTEDRPPVNQIQSEPAEHVQHILRGEEASLPENVAGVLIIQDEDTQ